MKEAIITYDLKLPDDAVLDQFQNINDASDLIKYWLENEYNFADHFSCSTVFFKLTNEELVGFFYNVRDLADDENIKVEYLLSDASSLKFIISDINDDTSKDTVLIMDENLLPIMEEALGIKFTHFKSKIREVDKQILRNQIASLTSDNSPRNTNLSIYNEVPTLVLRTSEIGAIIKGVEHISYVLNEFIEYEWLESKSTPMNSRSYKMLLITSLNEIILSIFSIRNSCYIEEYNFYIKLEDKLNTRIGTLMQRLHPKENRELLDTLINLDRKKKLTNLIIDL